MRILAIIAISDLNVNDKLHTKPFSKKSKDSCNFLNICYYNFEINWTTLGQFEDIDERKLAHHQSL